MSNENQTETPSGFIPIDRFKQVNQAKKAAEARVSELESIASAAEGYRAEINTLRSALEKESSSRSMTEALVDAGVYDRERRKLARYCYEQLEGEKPSFGDYLTSQREAPKGLMSNVWTAPASAETQTEPPTTSAEPPVVSQETREAPLTPSAPRVDPNRGVAPPRPPQGAITADYISSIDSETYAAQRDEIRRQYFSKR
jgi:hypothetical protein